MLLAATFFWGWTFPVIKEVVAGFPVFAFLFLRFTLAAAMMAPFCRRMPRASDWRRGAALGALLFAAFALQTWGLVYTSSSNSAFITGANVAWVVALHPASRRRGWMPAGVAMAGLWLLASPQSAFNPGDLLTLGCSLCIALHLLMLAGLEEDADSAGLAFVQFVFIAACSAALSLALEPIPDASEWSGDLVFALLLTAGGATVFAFWVQTHYQRRTTPLHTGMIFICEPVFAAIFAVFFYGEALQPAALPGIALILVAMIAAVRRGSPPEESQVKK